MRHLSGLLPDELKQEIYGLWEVSNEMNLIVSKTDLSCMTNTLLYLQEYETQSSPEARLVKQFDLLEMILQAHEYEELEGAPGRLQEFFDSTNGESEICCAFCLCVLPPSNEKLSVYHFHLL